MKSMNYGTLPSKEEILVAMKNEDFYPIGNPSRRDLEVLEAATIPVIDSHLEAVAWHKSTDSRGRLVIVIERESMHTLIRRLIEVWERDLDVISENAGTLASDILSTLGFEWV